MVNKVSDMLDYFHDNYDRDLDEHQLVLMVYLADWRSCLVNGEQITDIEWTTDLYYWKPHKIRDQKVVQDGIEPVLDHVLGATEDVMFLEVLAESTYPLVGYTSDDSLNLPELASEYQKKKEN